MTIDDSIPEGIAFLKNQFMQGYKNRRSLLTEIIPRYYSMSLPIENNMLDSLHRFATANGIYFSSHDAEISGIQCII